MKRLNILGALVLAAALLVTPAGAVEVGSGDVYCFASGDFSQEEISGICITGIPESGALKLGSRILRPGDILTADQIGEMTFHSLRSETDSRAVISYLGIYPDRVEPETELSIAVIGRQDKAPVAEDSTLETYRNLPNEGMLKVSDPEKGSLTFTVTRLPKRGDVVVRDDGSFVYTPKKNKVGVDSFTYTASDGAGNVSREATVTVTVLKPSDARQYTDTAGSSCRFAAEWMRNTGIFVAENINGNGCFRPEKEVSRGEFLTMLVGALEISPEEAGESAAIDADTPQWLRPYLAAALRSGLTVGLDADLPVEEPITGAEAAMLLQNALDLSLRTAAAEEEPADPADRAIRILGEHGITLNRDAVLTRSDAALVMYRVWELKDSAPGLPVLNAAQ